MVSYAYRKLILIPISAEKLKTTKVMLKIILTLIMPVVITYIKDNVITTEIELQTNIEAVQLSYAYVIYTFQIAIIFL